ncbi:hypothetical protein [Legionella fairfieldensis]|uniref:hypothetical protein n=1 Tax=Legionella fairfieldensis TaxID=45064 RepID=UPI001040F5B0|nr:hypothetical protein [Legionella fairfieldensis]
MTLDNNTLPIEKTQLPVTFPYSITHNHIPFGNENLNSANAKKTRSDRTHVASVAKNPYHFFPDSRASLPSSSSNTLDAQDHTRKRKLTP